MTAPLTVDQFLDAFLTCSDLLLSEDATVETCLELHPEYRPWLSALLPVVVRLQEAARGGVPVLAEADRARFVDLIARLPQHPPADAEPGISVRGLLAGLPRLAGRGGSTAASDQR